MLHVTCQCVSHLSKNALALQIDYCWLNAYSTPMYHLLLSLIEKNFQWMQKHKEGDMPQFSETCLLNTKETKALQNLKDPVRQEHWPRLISRVIVNIVHWPSFHKCFHKCLVIYETLFHMVEQNRNYLQVSQKKFFFKLVDQPKVHSKLKVTTTSLILIYIFEL